MYLALLASFHRNDKPMPIKVIETILYFSLRSKLPCVSVPAYRLLVSCFVILRHYNWPINHRLPHSGLEAWSSWQDRYLLATKGCRYICVCTPTSMCAFWLWANSSQKDLKKCRVTLMYRNSENLFLAWTKHPATWFVLAVTTRDTTRQSHIGTLELAWGTTAFRNGPAH